MKIGLYFGTFNPIHIGHMIIANHMAENSDLDQVWMVVTPHNPLKKKASLLDNYQRYEMVYLATEGFSKIHPSDIEFQLPQPSYTINTLVTIKEKFPKNDFSLIMGEDNLQNLHKWKNHEEIIKNHHIYVYPRVIENSRELSFSQEKIHKINAPIIEISSTYIRKSIKENINITPLLPQKVSQYIEHQNFYKK